MEVMAVIIAGRGYSMPMQSTTHRYLFLASSSAQPIISEKHAGIYFKIERRARREVQLIHRAGLVAQLAVGGKLGFVPLHVEQVFGGGSHLEASPGVAQHGIKQEVAAGLNDALHVGWAAVDVAVAQAGAQAAGPLQRKAAQAGEARRQRDVVLALGHAHQTAVVVV